MRTRFLFLAIIAATAIFLSTPALAQDADGDGRTGAADCNDADPNNWVSCASCTDSDFDGRWAGCDAYVTHQGPDCNNNNSHTWNTCATCLDGDGDGWVGICNDYSALNGPDCNDANINASTTCATCVDADGDGAALLCDRYLTVSGPDCNDANLNTWDTCATCVDADADGRYRTCNNYSGINGPDCSDLNPNTWDTCATCVDADGDSWYGVCNTYAGINSPDCSPSDPNHWNDCGACVDADADGRGTSCNLGEDCNDANQNTWNTCATCVDADADGWYMTCNNYSGINGPDCNDLNPNTWNTCAGCIDNDLDGWYVGCNQYVTVSGPDCSDTNPNAWDTCATCVDPDGDGWYGVCNTYAGINSPDCSPSDPNHWNDCGACVDSDADGRGTSCNKGEDCTDANPFTWDTCATCADADLDNWYAVCNRYSAGTGTVTIGTGTFSQVYPLGSDYHDARSQLIYLQSEIGGAGAISSLQLDVTTIPGQVLNNFTIRMKHTNASSYSAVAWESAGWTTVYQGNVTISSTGWNTFTLSTPFAYNGIDNLMIDISFNNSTYSSYGYVRYTGATANRALYYRTNSAFGDPLTWNGTTPTASISPNRPNIRLVSPSINGPDCDDNNTNTWNTCAGCIDADLDGWYVGCNQYVTVSGPDCSDTNPNTWNTCASCVEADGDGWYGVCNTYAGINGPDCSPSDPNHWNDCGACVDADGDGRGTSCNQGTDCNDANFFTWDTCATCVDADLDNWYAGCNRYSGSTVTVGTGTGTQIYPLATGYHDARSQLIYLQSEVGGAGIISSLQLDVTTIPGQVLNNFSIRMKHTAASSYSAVAWESAGWTIVYQGNVTISSTGWKSFTLSTPFAYNGASNLMIDISFNNSTYTSNGYVRYTGAVPSRALHYRTDSVYGDPLTWNGTTPTGLISANRPNIRLAYGGSINGPDCSDTNTNAWDTCATCVDADADGRYGTCNIYQTVSGPDCSDTNTNAWTTCATCVDNDSDSWYSACNRYNGINGPDCSDTNTNVWATCATCVDADGDSWYAGCDRYQTISGPDCDNSVAAIHPGQSSPEEPSLCDGLDNQCPGETGYGSIDEGCSPDTDGDGLRDNTEVSIGTDPGDTDTDDDGLSDGEEYLTRGTDPLGWDSDDDALPDAFEVANLIGHPAGKNLNPLASADGTADFDGDGIANADDYWNGGGIMTGGSGGAVSGGGVYVADKVGWPACGYWGEGDGDGFISPGDLAVISLAVKGKPGYGAVYPATGETQDLDADTFLSPSDKGLLSQMIKGQEITTLGSRPAAISRVAPATGVNLSGAVGDAVTVTVAVTNTATVPASGIPVIFSIAASSTGSATIVGGEGADALSTRYDLTTARADNGQATVTLVLTAAGTVTVEAKVKQCGADGIGRYCAEVLLAEPVVITISP